MEEHSFLTKFNNSVTAMLAQQKYMWRRKFALEQSKKELGSMIYTQQTNYFKINIFIKSFLNKNPIKLNEKFLQIQQLLEYLFF